MNDKIKELIKKATVSYPSHGAFGEYEESEVLEGELLVKLVVEECIKVCESGYEGEFTVAGIRQCVSGIRKHFEIEK